MKRRSLTEEELRLWKLVTQHAVPLHGEEEMDVWEEKPVEKRSPPKISVSPHPHLPTQFYSSELARGNYAGIDRNTADRFRKGDYPIDAELDLHGMSREKAHMALGRFMRAQYERESRCLLVVTGKGVRKDVSDDAPRGILREMLPQWLTEPGLQPMVLAFDVAKPRHGGSGAFYILLRRRR